MSAALAFAALSAALTAAPSAWPSARLLAQADAAAPSDPKSMTYAQLQVEYDRLVAARPNLVGPIVLVSGCEVGFAMAADLLYTGIGVGFGTSAGTGVATGSNSGWVLVTLGAVLFVASALFGIYGTVRLYDVIRRRFELGAQMDEVRARMTDPSSAPPPAGALPRLGGGFVLAEL